MTRLTIMTTEEIVKINTKIKELKVMYIDALDDHEYEKANQLYDEIRVLNNSIR